MKRGKRSFKAVASCTATALIAIGFATAPLVALAQTVTPDQKAPSESGSASNAIDHGSNNVNAEVLAELQRMRARIQELEARLKGQSSPPAESNPVVNQQQALAAQVLTNASASAEAPEAEPKAAAVEPLAFADFTWLNGNPRTKDSPLSTSVFTGEFRLDASYIYDFHHPQDHTLGGTTESGRTGEVQVQQLGIGGDFHYNNVRGRLMTQFGMYSTMTPRNDASVARGQWQLDNAYRYLSEAYGGYHFNALKGINVDAGIFMSYIGLFSYYNFDNWAYQPSYVSSNTPWFFNGVRVQIFPTEKLKIEPWFINGWQSYGKFNHRPGIGFQIAYRPNGSIAIVSNNYGVGTDTLGNNDRSRWHTDNSIEVKYYDRPTKLLDKMAFSLTGDAGCESGGGVSCFGNGPGGPKQSFLGFMFYNRFWFHRDMFGLTLGGGRMNNPGRYLTSCPRSTVQLRFLERPISH